MNDDAKKEEKEIDKKIEKDSALGTLKAKDFMSKKIFSVTPDASIRETLLILKENDLSGLPVVEKGGKLVGIISDYDILLLVAQRPLDEKIVFKKDLVTVTSETPLKEILVTFVRFRLRRIPVVDAFQKLVGIIYRNEFIFKIMEVKISEEKKSEAA